jgi:hypothetical protein
MMKDFQMDLCDNNRRYFRIAGITVCVESDLDFNEIKFKPELARFAVDGPGDDNVLLRHHFKQPNMSGQDLGMELYHKASWKISRNAERGTWFYHFGEDRIAVFAADHTYATIYSPTRDAEWIRTDGWHSLSLFPSDQIWLAPLLADRRAFLLHSAGVILNGLGLLFVGHSSAGKSTMVTLLKNAAICDNDRASLRVEVLCDDRNIARRWPDDWRVHGTWSHGDVEDVSSSSAPLRAILFLQQETRNEIVPLNDRREIWKRLLATLIKPVVTAEWWRKEIDVLEQIVNDVPCYTMHFDKSGAIVDRLATL